MRSVLPLLLVLIVSSTIATDAGAPPIGRPAPATSGSTAGTQAAPALGHSDAARKAPALGSTPGVVQRQTGGATGGLSAQEKSELSSIARLIAESPSSPAVKSRWQAYIQRNGSSQTDVNALVQYVMRESYAQSTQDLQFYADKVKYYNEQKKQIRSQMRQQHQSPSANPGLGQAQQDVAKQATGSKLALQGPGLQRPHKTKIVQQQKEETAGEDAQLANVDLQNVLQQQQRAKEQMSNMSKMLHDLAMAVIRKIN